MKFQYTPLEDAAAEIRLLKICSFDNATEKVELRITSHFIIDAPEFVAISYTWGSPSNLSSVLLNDSWIEIRENCHRALSQCRQQNIKQHIWIDSICINQDDVDEKGTQVAMMASLYKHASQVLVSIQPPQHSEPRSGNIDSTILAELANVVKERLLEGDLGPTNVDRDNYDSLVDEGAIILAERRLPMRDAIKRIARAENWTRLWILQELAMSKRACLIFCGELVDLEALYLLIRVSDRLEGEVPDDDSVGESHEGPEKSADENPDADSEIAPDEPPDLISGTPMGVALAVRYMAPEGSRLDLAGVLVRYSNWRCFDPRDRIYGTMAFIHWPGSRPIQVDYSVSRAELAVRVLDHHNNQNTIVQLVRALVEALKLSLEDVQELIRSAKSPEITCTLRTICSIRIGTSIPVASGAIDDRSTRGTNVDLYEDEIALQLPGLESYPVIKEDQEELQNNLQFEKVLTETDHQENETILSHATVMLDQGVCTETCTGCGHSAFASEPRSFPRQYLEPGDLIFSGLNGPDAHVPAMAVILKIQPAVVPGPYTYCAADLADLLSDRSNYCHSCFCAGYQEGDDASRPRVAALTILDILILASRARDVMQLGQPCHHARGKEHMRSQHELRGVQLVTISASLQNLRLEARSTSGFGDGNS